LTSQGLSDYVLSLASTGMPLAFLYTFLNYWLFGVQNLVPAIVVLLLIIINSYLWIAIIEKISRSKFIAIGSLLIGYISYLSIQAVTWVLPAISAQATFLFINCAVWFLLEYQSKKSLKFIILSLTSAVAAALMRNNGFLI